MKNIFLIGLLLIITISCEKDRIETPPIQGTWIESIYKTDTLVFDNQSKRFNLYRGGENLSHKVSSIPFVYDLKKDSISISWLLSSATFGSFKYYFDLDEEKKQMKIGNFFVDSLDSKTELTFSKIN